jgi:two-component system nitrogen regulation response regulator NtrX
MSQEKILIIDDEASIRTALQGILQDEGYEVGTAQTGEQGLEELKSRAFELVLLDIWLPGKSGLEILEEIRAAEDAPQVVMISGHGTIETAVRATKLGAFDFLEKPLTLEKVVLTVQHALRERRLEEENIQLRQRVRVEFPLVGESAAIRRVRDTIERAAPSNGRVLIIGESGTGKQQVATLIHQKSRRRDQKLVVLNCAAIPDSLLENELFGYVMGSAPHAIKDKKGKLLLADRGTFFLAEIGRMNTMTQAKLVRVIQEGRFEPTGSTEAIPFDTRLITATTRPPKELIAAGALREDFFFLLNVVPIVLPALRERREDIPGLIEYFLDAFAAEYGKRRKTMTDGARQAFLNYSWPGNVHELQNVIERFIIMIDEDVITTSHLALLVEAREAQPPAGATLSLGAAAEQFERTVIQRALQRNAWDEARTAAELQIGETELRSKVRRHRITLVE